ncbi:RNI-like protein [Mycena chlorophos]|uniref:RNI-like protein n=1 Tax=Mycena chlorophos TaxID=658473 RepID=A0A8H6SWD4_MYCCL|nr:RNI-like protein [Mycena chlorophos]
MARNVRGPMSALTDFLQSEGITATTIARRVATQQPEAGPSTPRRGRGVTNDAEEYDSDNLDEPESPQKKSKLSKAAEAKAKAKAAKKKNKGDDEDEDEDAYTALSKAAYAPSNKPAVGSFADCAQCEKKFTVTKYTMAAIPGPGYLCHPCAKEAGIDPFKKPAAPRKRKAPAEKRTVVHIQQRSFPTLVSLCIDVIARYIDDVESFGDIGSLNLEAIAKALSKNRRLTSENARLFYNIENANLAFYDATNLDANAFIALGNLNPNLTHLRLDLCGPLNDQAILSWNTSMPRLVSLELLGPFLVREAAWITFLTAHPNMEAFLITQSPRFSLACLNALIAGSGATLRRLGLREVGLISDAFTERIGAELKELTYLDIGMPSESLLDVHVIDLLTAIGGGLEHLDLSGHEALTDNALTRGIAPHVRKLTSLALASLPELTDAGVAAFFNLLRENERPGFVRLDMTRDHQLNSAALTALLLHSGDTLQELSINGWKGVDAAYDQALVKKEEQDAAALPLLAQLYQVRKLDLGWCRAVDDFTVKAVLESCLALEELKVWGCNRVEGKWESSIQRKRGVKVYGIESQALAHSQSADRCSPRGSNLWLRAEPPSTTRPRLILNADSLASPRAQPRRLQHPPPPQTGASEHSAPTRTSPLRATTIYGTKHHGRPTACGLLVPQTARRNNLLSAVSPRRLGTALAPQLGVANANPVNDDPTTPQSDSELHSVSSARCTWCYSRCPTPPRRKPEHGFLFGQGALLPAACSSESCARAPVAFSPDQGFSALRLATRTFKDVRRERAPAAVESLAHCAIPGHSRDRRLQALTDNALTRGIAPHVRKLTSLALASLPELTDAGVAAFFNLLRENERPGFVRLDMTRDHQLNSAALTALLLHSGDTLQELSINGWKGVDAAYDQALVKKEEQDAAALPLLAQLYQVRKLDLGWCRAVDDFTVKAVLESCLALEELKVWGCNRVEGKWESSIQRKRGVKTLSRVQNKLEAASQYRSRTTATYPLKYIACPPRRPTGRNRARKNLDGEVIWLGRETSDISIPVGWDDETENAPPSTTPSYPTVPEPRSEPALLETGHRAVRRPALAHSQSADRCSPRGSNITAEPPSTTRPRLIVNADSLASPRAQSRRWRHPPPPQTGASEHSAPTGSSPLRATTIYGTKHHGTPTACGLLVPQTARRNSLLSAVSPRRLGTALAPQLGVANANPRESVKSQDDPTTPQSDSELHSVSSARCTWCYSRCPTPPRRKPEHGFLFGQGALLPAACSSESCARAPVAFSPDQRFSALRRTRTFKDVRSERAPGAVEFLALRAVPGYSRDWDFLQSEGITATTIARRVATQQPEAGPSTPRRGRGVTNDAEEYDSDNLDEPESPQKKSKLSKAAEAKAKAKAAKKKNKGDDEDEDEDAYTALSKAAYAPSNKPAVGSFADCAQCEKKFTVTKYTMAAIPGPGYLCHPCAKEAGIDPFKKPAAPRKRKAPAEKRTVVHIQQRSFPTLVSLCIDVIARYIDDVESFGDIGSLNLEAIAKALSKNRRLTSENARLFYNIENANLAFYDATNLDANAFIALGNLNPNLTHLRLDLCGPLNDQAILSWNTSMPRLVSLELLGPFLVREAAWITFLTAHPNMEAFLITQSPRFSLACLNALIAGSGATLGRLGLREVGLLSDAFTERIGAELKELTYLDIGMPSKSLLDVHVIDLLAAIGGGLEHLDLSGHEALTDNTLTRGIAPHVRKITSLALASLPELTDAGVAAFFSLLRENERPGFVRLDMTRDHQLNSAALTALLLHSGDTLQELSINGWKGVDAAYDQALVKKEEQDAAALPLLAQLYQVRKLDLGWCRAVDDFTVKAVLESCLALEELKVWGCNRVEGKWESSIQRKRGVKVYGIESQGT